MISSKRVRKAEQEGRLAAIRCKGNPWLTKCDYHKFTAQWRAWNKGWNKIRTRFKFLRKAQ